MTKATKFYLPFFKTGYPSGKLYTYKSGTSILASTYKSTDGTLNTNPIIMDENGECILYIDADITYRYVLYDANNNLIYDQSNIRQLNGEPGSPGGPVGPAGKKGKKGGQGISGNQGITGNKGPIGDKGYPYLTRINISSNQTITIPKGISEIFISGTGAGGAGASWSPYIYLYKVNDNGAATVKYFPPAQVTGATGISTSTVPITYFRSKFASFMFIPGSGMSGQSIYRRKISLDKERENVLQVITGTGGARPSGSLNGKDGTSTLILLNGSQILELKGGFGGKNYFPMDSNTIPSITTDGAIIRLNRGHKTGLLYFNQFGTDNISNPAQGQSLYSWTTTYRQKNGNSYIDKEVKLSYYAPLITVDLSSACYNAYPVSNDNSGMGERNIFGNYYSSYQFKTELNSQSPLVFYSTAVKTSVNEIGWGAGGDVYCNFISSQSSSSGSGYVVGTIPAYLSGTSSQSSIAIFEESVIKAAIRSYMSSFNIPDSYAPGVASIPLVSDVSGVWQGVDNIKSLIDSNPSTYLKFQGSNFYLGNGLRIPVMTINADSAGGKGVDGFVLIEYGNMVEHFPSNT